MCVFEKYNIPLKKVLNSSITKFFLFLITNAIVFIFCANIFPIRFLTIDDIIMAWIADGVVTGSPDCHLIFINAIYGELLVLLYDIFPNIEWYSVFFSIFHVVSITIIITFFYHKIENRFIRFIVILLYYLLWLRIIQFFQFTTTAAMLAFSGILLLYDRKYIIGGFIFLISSLLRFHAAGLVGLLSIPIFFHYYKADMKKYLPIVVMLLVVMGFHCADSFFYQSSEWKNYREFNYYRGKIQDNPNSCVLSTSEIPEHISLENYFLLRSAIPDPSQISNDDLKELASIVKSTPFMQKCRNMPYSIIHYSLYGISFLCFLLLLCSFLLITNRFRRKIFILLTFTFFIGIIWLISLDGYIKERIIESCCFVLFSYVLLVDTSFKMELKSIIIEIIPFLCSCIVLSHAIIQSYKQSEECGAIEQIRLIECLDPNLRVIDLTKASQNVSPYHLHRYPKHKIIIYDWLTKSPLSENESFRETIDGDIAFFIYKDSDISYFQKALFKNYGIETETYINVQSEHYAIISLYSKNHLH